MIEAAISWHQAFTNYHYAVDLTRCAAREHYPGWFNCDLRSGNSEQTIRFEDHFRKHGKYHIEVWYEVVFWKMFTQGRGGRGNFQVKKLIEHVNANRVSSGDLWSACYEYTRSETRETFGKLSKRLGFSAGNGIAITATFPAFMEPNRFPMVDTRVAKWVSACASRYNSAEPTGPQLVPPVYPGNGRTVVTMADWPFVSAWTQWCRHAACKLNAATCLVKADKADAALNWRARDVEMAVFWAWGDKGQQRPAFDLPTGLGLSEERPNC
jgi:hypothetical protein